MRDIANITDHYLICALWSGGDGDEFDGVDISEVDPESRKGEVEEIESFLKMADEKGLDLSWWSDEQLGHDFWLTRNGHGAGFWDRGQGEVGDKAADIASTFQSRCVVRGGDGRIYIE